MDCVPRASKLAARAAASFIAPGYFYVQAAARILNSALPGVSRCAFLLRAPSTYAAASKQFTKTGIFSMPAGSAAVQRRRGETRILNEGSVLFLVSG